MITSNQDILNQRAVNFTEHDNPSTCEEGQPHHQLASSH